MKPQILKVRELLGEQAPANLHIQHAVEMNGGNPHLAAAQLIERMAAETAVKAQPLPPCHERDRLRRLARKMLDDAAQLRADGRKPPV